MRRVLIAFLALVAVGLVGATAAAVRVARSSAPAALADWARSIGATVRVEGAADFAYLPSPRAVAHDVRLTIPGVADVRAGTVEIVAHPATLVHGRFVAGGIVLRSAAVVLGGGGPPADLGALGPVDLVDGRLILGGGLPDLDLSGRLRATEEGAIAVSARLGSGGAVSTTLALGPAIADGQRPVRIVAGRGEDEIRFDGHRGDGAGGPTMVGRLAVVAPGLAQTLAALALPADLVPVRAVDATATVRLGPDGGSVEGIRGQADIGDVAGSVAWGSGGLVVRADAGRVPAERLLPPAVALVRRTEPVDIALRLAGLTFGEIELGVSALDVRRADRALVASLADAALFDGAVGGRLEARTGPAGGLALDGSVRVNGLDLERLLRALGLGPAVAGEIRGRLDWRLPPDPPGAAAAIAWPARLMADGTFVLTGGRIGVGVFGLGAALPLDGLSGTVAVADGRANSSSLALVSPPQRFAGRGTVALSDGTVDLAFAPVDGAPGPLPSVGFRLRGRGNAARVEPAPVAVEGLLPTFPARAPREEPRSPPTPLPAGVGRGD